LTSGSWGWGLERIPEEHERINHRAVIVTELLIPERTAAQARDRQVELITQESTRRAGRDEIVAGEYVAVEASPLEQVRLLVVVGDERDLSTRRNCVWFSDHVGRP
jgi:hypothetical protein